MRAAQVRSIAFSSGASLLCGLLFLTAGSGCGDDGGQGSEGTGGSSGTTTRDASTTTDPGTTAGAGTTSETGTGSTTGSDSSTTQMSGSSSTGSSSSSTGDTSGSDSSSSTGDTTGARAVDVPFTVLDSSVLELTVRAPAGWVLVTTAAQWATLTEVPVPDGVTFPTQWVLLGSRGPQPYPGHSLVVDALSWQGDTLSVAGDRVEPADDCDTYAFIWPADTLLAFDALDDEVATIDDQTMTTEVSCAAGATTSMSCDLDTPCASDLLCAGIIRSTVLASNPGGLCLDTNNRGTFDGGNAAIPGDGATVEIPLQASDLATVDMDVTILLDINHPAPEELVIRLRNPDSNEVLVADQQSSPLHPGGIPIVPTGFSGDESVNGTWVLSVRDAIDNDNNGSVQGWTLEIMSRLD